MISKHWYIHTVDHGSSENKVGTVMHTLISRSSGMRLHGFPTQDSQGSVSSLGNTVSVTLPTGLGRHEKDMRGQEKLPSALMFKSS